MRHRLLWCSAALALGAAALALAAPDAQAQCISGPQANDCFANAIAVPAAPFVAATSTAGATMEPGEPATCGPHTLSLWYKWTPTTSGTATISHVRTGGGDPMLGVFTGNSVSGLTLVACNDDNNAVAGWPNSSLKMDCQAGVTYMVQAGSWSNTAGPGQLTISDCLPETPGCEYDVMEIAYDFTDIDPAIGGGGIGIPGSYYSSSYAVQPGFEFKLCGLAYNTFWLSGAGFICMGPTPVATGTTNGFPAGCNSYTATPLPSPVAPNAAVYGFRGLLNANACAGGSTACNFYKVTGTAPYRILIHEFKDVPIYLGSPPQTFQIKLFERTNCIEVHYKSIQRPGQGWTYWTQNYATFGAGFEGGVPLEGYEYEFSPETSEGSTFARTKTAWRACPFGVTPDFFAVNEDQEEAAFDVLANDNGGGHPFSVTWHTEPTKGLLTGPFNGYFLYKPFPDQTGQDSFSYGIENAVGKTSNGTVILDINPVNDPPRFQVSSDVVVVSQAGGVQQVRGWATAVQAGPRAAIDERQQEITFAVDVLSNAEIFAATPTVRRAMTATGLPAGGPPSAGEYGMLEVKASGASGTARVCVTALDNGGVATVTNSWGESATGIDRSLPRCIDIVANSAPVAYFEPNPARAAPGQSIVFDSCPGPPPHCTYDADDSIERFEWDFGDGATGSAPSPVHAFAAPGSFTVRLAVLDTRGAVTFYMRNVEVAWADAPPDAVDANAGEGLLALAGEDRTVPQGHFVRLLGDHEGGSDLTTYAWTQERGIPVLLTNSTTPYLSFTAPVLPAGVATDLLFSLRVEDGGATSAPDFVAVHVVPSNHAPVARARIDGEARPGATLVLDAGASTDDDGDKLTFLWEQVAGPAVTLVDAQSPVARFEAPAGTEAVRFRVTVSDGMESGSDEVEAALNPIVPAAKVSFAYDIRPTSDGAEVRFTALGTSEASWDFGDGATATGAAVLHRFPPGRHVVTMRAIDAPDAHDAQEIVVGPPASQAATAAPLVPGLSIAFAAVGVSALLAVLFVHRLRREG